MGNTTINDFIVNSELGRGAFGIVYSAIRKSDGRKVAIKKIDKEKMRRNNVLNRGPITEKQLRPLLKDLIDGLLYLHSKNIIHRDLKLSNLLLTKNHLKIADFGLAVKLSQQEQKTLCGTPNYISPEIVKRQPYGLASDAWSLGCMIVTLLTGSPPFEDPVKRPKMSWLLQHQFFDTSLLNSELVANGLPRVDSAVGSLARSSQSCHLNKKVVEIKDFKRTANNLTNNENMKFYNNASLKGAHHTTSKVSNESGNVHEYAGCNILENLRNVSILFAPSQINSSIEISTAPLDNEKDGAKFTMNLSEKNADIPSFLIPLFKHSQDCLTQCLEIENIASKDPNTLYPLILKSHNTINQSATMDLGSKPMSVFQRSLSTMATQKGNNPILKETINTCSSRTRVASVLNAPTNSLHQQPVFLNDVGWCIKLSSDEEDLYCMLFLDGVNVTLECKQQTLLYRNSKGDQSIDKSLPSFAKEKLGFFPKFLGLLEK
ncbi:Serine/threonine-protein kinase plk4 [Clydaea vesicula]|uniref:Serine/threonine-protein kinase plk4 n=1 Tax=Clydaea vesicula TaxID=447962 RepID=A0AAD5UAR3_9FUNG|nr:Serine/threonine-protein kinase plk4 [Clydaea vesicula]